MKTVILVFLSIMLSTSVALACGGAMDTHHTDHRSTAKICIEPSWDSLQAATPVGTARAFLENQADHYGLTRDLLGLELTNERESLLARHFTFQQMINGIPVQNGEIIVSIAKADNRVLRTFNNIYPAGEGAAFLATAGLDEDAAYDIAWNRIRAHGELRSLPRAELVYTPEGEGFRLNWLIDLDISGPDGGWRARIDAQSGQVVELTDERLTRVPLAPVEERIAEHAGPVGDFQSAVAQVRDLEAKRAERVSQPATNRASGTGVVFDPDPRTTLRNNNLQNNSAASLFAEAYFTRDLLDIEYDGSRYRLNGPWVHILDWDSPNTPPSTTADGNWTSTRGPNSFNDAMTYFHLDQTQRYIQSLGFEGDHGVQYGSIGADTDGFNGADNSAYYGGSNRLTFGHGCVDDNEDADVILHEYGHAINYSINHSWGGGDAGAMGEGWGDYWGASYSYICENGDIFFPNYIYSWDGHGYGNQCWQGRIMNAHGAQYVHSTTYGAHVGIPGGYVSDELWGTPLFQSLLTLMNDHGQTRDSVDALMLEAQFGLGSGLKMRDMANVIIATAQVMYPEGPHAQVLVEKFLVHNIIIAPVPAIGIESFEVIAEPSGNGAADPGETVDVRVTLTNAGLAGASAVSAVLTTTTDGITISQDAADFPDLPAGGEGTSTVDYTISVGNDVECGTKMEFNLAVDYNDNGSPATDDRPNQLFVGEVIGGYGLQAPYQPLPDNDGGNVISIITVSGTGATVSENMNMDINVTHSAIGDLVMWLTSPSGTRAYLHLRSGGSAHDIIGNFPNTMDPAQSFDRFLGEPLDGDWELMVKDSGDNGTGHLNSWAFYDITGFDCDSGGTTSAPSDVAAVRFALNQNAPNPFNPATTISFTVPANAGLVSLDIYDVKGQKVRTLERSHLESGQHSRTWNGRDDSGVQASSGVYFYRLAGNEFTQTRKMVIVQ